MLHIMLLSCDTNLLPTFSAFLSLKTNFFQEKIGLLLGTGGKTFKRIGSLFKVHIHLTSGHHQSGEWVSIYGKEEDRGRAKVSSSYLKCCMYYTALLS